MKTLNRNKGFTLLMAIVTTSLLLVVSFMVVNIAFKQLLISSVNKQSQYAFYAADSGSECAVYWDLHDPTISQFSTTTSGSISCASQTITTNSQTVPTVPSQPSLIGGGGDGSVSIFKIDYLNACAIVRVTKTYVGQNIVTTIDSRGYNTCSTSSNKRYERGITLTY